MKLQYGMGRGRRRRADGMRRHRRGVLAGGLPAADVGGDGWSRTGVSSAMTIAS